MKNVVNLLGEMSYMGLVLVPLFAIGNPKVKIAVGMATATWVLAAIIVGLLESRKERV